MESAVATLALLLWPLVAAVLFSVRPAVQATLWTIVGAQLLLPVGTGIKFEMIPSFDKATLPSFCIFLGYLIVVGRPWHPRFGIAEVLVAIFLFGPIITSMLNGDPVFAGDRVIPGVGLYDAVSAVEAALIVLLPFFVGRGLFRTEQANEQVLKALVVAGLFYSIPMLFEMRFSPQFHFWIYGYFPTDFIQQVRDGGYRPMVFTGHGLIAAIFLFMSVTAAAALWRSGGGLRRSGGVTAYLGAVLILCRSAGATLFGAIVVPLVCFAKPKLQARVAVVFVLLALFYPMLRVADLVPTRLMVELAQSVSFDRASSLQVRFENEASLLERALQRPIFGWGRYGRSRIYDEGGKDVSVTDGHWVIAIGQFGILGFVAEFGLLALCVIKAAAAARHARSFKENILLTALALIVATNVVDLLPNASLLPMTWLFSGALLGRAEALQQAAMRLSTSASGRFGHPDITPSTSRFG
ncbi:hypothetical protein V1286_004808 [Bradyrhizobium algeriense]|uniref:O-antigen ligase family protein n=1 Tax=Bradyrhizobium algeriense TaxID=634784 RepID=A0ABU8BFF7_9BRAD